MVRIIVGTAAAISDGRCLLPSENHIEEKAHARGRNRTAAGLFLEKVIYPGMKMPDYKKKRINRFKPAPRAKGASDR
ncbi:MAG: hypothetical protein ACLR56_08485 [Oscillospiraceae bacterium]